MTDKERVREPMSSPPIPEHVRQKAEEGWSLVAVEWERPIKVETIDAGKLKEEIPYGLMVASDCKHLEENPEEKEAMVLMLEMIVEDKSLSEVAAGLNRQGMKTRHGSAWTQSAVFWMLPRLIEAAPQIFSSETWRERRNEVATRMEKLIGCP